MPYLNPSRPTTPTPAPLPLPVHSQGRPRHRRSFSYNHADSSSPAWGSDPSTTPSTTTTTTTMTGTTGAFASLGALPRRKSASFHIVADDDDDDSSPEDNSSPLSGPSSAGSTSIPFPSSSTTAPAPTRFPPPTPTPARFAGANLKVTPSGKPAQLNTDDEDDQAARGLPPLKLRIPGVFGSGGPGSPNTLPFPTASPPMSRTSSASNLEGHVRTPSQVAQGADTSGRESPRSSFHRTTSSSILLANGKPLKSSLKSSSSSPNIPFPSQSLVPSRMYAEIAAAQAGGASSPSSPSPSSNSNHHHHHHQHVTTTGLTPSQRHIRAASAPNLPNFDASSSSSTPGSSDDNNNNQDMMDGSLTVPSTPSAPKVVHFPSSEEGGLATIRVFKRTAKPVSLLLPGASGGEETETETDGEGYNSGGGGGSGWNVIANPGANGSGGGGNAGFGGAGYHYGIRSTWGFGFGYSNPWDRYTRQQQQNASGVQVQQKGPNGYPFPRIAGAGAGVGSVVQGKPSPLGLRNVDAGVNGNSSTSGAALGKTAPMGTSTGMARGAGKPKEEKKKRIVYEVDGDKTSGTPKRDLSLFDHVFLESVQLACQKSPSSSTGSSSSSSEDDDNDHQDGHAGSVSVSSSLVATLSGTLLVRNLAYEKHVSVRFTLDDWHTTSEVKALYKESLGGLPAWLRGWVCGDRQHPPQTKPTSPTSPLSTSSPPNPPSPPSNNPQWDRFEFSINLSDYARSRSLGNRILWLVVRYGVPGQVKVPVGVATGGSLGGISSSAATAMSSGLSRGVNAQGEYTSEVLERSESEMVELLVKGFRVNPGDEAKDKDEEQQVSSRELVDRELRKRRMVVGSGLANEWWDNNGGGNYRIGFREREVVVVGRPFGGDASTPASASTMGETKGEDEAVEELGKEDEQEQGQGQVLPAQRRKNLSLPGSLSNSNNGLNAGNGNVNGYYSTLSPPQVSVSTSVDSGSYPPPPLPPPPPYSYSYTNSSGNTITTGTNVSGSNQGQGPAVPTANTADVGGGGSLATGVTPSLFNASARRAETNKAMAETTLERLKRLNLRNYAAPGVVVGGRTSSNPLPMGTPPAPSLVTSSSTSSLASAVNHQHHHINNNSNNNSGYSYNYRSETSSTTDSTPLTSPLHTPTMANVDDVVVVGEDSGHGHGHGISRTLSEDGHGQEEEARKKGVEEEVEVDGALRPLLSRHATVIPVTSSGVGEGAMGSGATTPTLGLNVGMDIPPRNGNEEERLSPLLEPFMSGAGVVELGTSPPFSSLGERMSFGGRSFGLVVGAGGEKDVNNLPSSVNVNSDSNNATLTAASNVNVSPDDANSTAKLRTVDLLNLRPHILENIREKNTSSPVRSPVSSLRGSPTGSGRSSPAPVGYVVNSALTPTGGGGGGLSPSPSTSPSASDLAALATPKPRMMAPGLGLAGLHVTERERERESMSGSGSDSNTTGSGSGKSGSANSAHSGSGGSKTSTASRTSSGSGGSGGRVRKHPRSAGGVAAGHRGLGLVLSGANVNPNANPNPNLNLNPTINTNVNGQVSPQWHTGSASPTAVGARSGSATPPISPMSPSRQASADDIRDPDSIYQAFVRQWCFASAPSPAQAGGFGGLSDRRKAL